MAKDKEKLFKGADDKAITFQRAVFIVCNLKRLIKRPKKDDKHGLGGASGSSRKRSGTNDDDEEERKFSHLQGAMAGGRKSRFKNPIRRAFTLPTMLCSNTFSLVVQPMNINSADDDGQEVANLMDLDGPRRRVGLADSVSGGRDDLFAAYDDRVMNTNTSRQQLVVGGGHSGAAVIGTQAVMGNCNDNRYVSGPNNRCFNADGKIKTSKLQQQQQQSHFGSGYNENIPTTALLADGTTSISCLITPIRSRTGASSAGSHQNSMNSATPSVITRRCTVQGDSLASGAAKQADPVQQNQIWCPIWLHAMDQLDARQKQPRQEGGSPNHIEPPSSQSYLMAPQSECKILGAPVDLRPTDNRLEPTTGSTPEDSNQQHLVAFNENENELDQDDQDEDQDRDDDEHQAGSCIPSRRSSNDSVRRSRRRRRKSIDKNPSHPAEVADYEYGAGIRRGPQNDYLAASQSHLLVDSAPRVGNQSSSSRQSTSPDSDCGPVIGNGKSSKGRRNQQQIATIKRYNSTLSLGEQKHHIQPDQARQKGSSKSPESRKSRPRLSDDSQASDQNMLANRHRQSMAGAGFGTGRNSGAKMSTISDSCNFMLSPEDPMILARKRRPSVSNQGSVNVDQQALFSAVECNQLERVKTILEDGKVDINSLNGDKLTCLDIAVLLRNVDMVRLLQQYKAKESSAYLSQEGRANQLYALYMEARRLVEDLSRSLDAFNSTNSTANQFNYPESGQSLGTNSISSSTCNSNNNNNNNNSSNNQSANNLLGLQSSAMACSSATTLTATSLLSTALLEEKQRQLQYWKRRLYLFMHMRYEFERLRVPDPPELIVLQVVGERSLGVKIVHSLRPTSGGANAASNVHQYKHQNPMAMAQINQSPAEIYAHSGQSTLCQPEQKLHCAQGPKCLHWYVSDLPASGCDTSQAASLVAANFPIKQNSMNIQSSIMKTTHSQQQQQQQQEAEALKQQKLAAFNQLLNQQLILLSNHRHQIESNPKHSRRFYNMAPDSRYSSSNYNNNADNQLKQYRQTRCQMMMYSQHNSNSTETACDSMGTKHSSFVNDDEWSTSGANSGELRASDLNQPFQSIAYTLLATGSLVDRRNVPMIDCKSQMSKFQSKAQPIAMENWPSKSVVVNDRGMIITKYKIEWSLNERMDPIINSMIVYSSNLYPLECQVDNLANGQTYYVQVSAGNHKGFSESRPTTPMCLSPSSWRQVDGNKRRKYDEEVYKRFTKLILLNKHILDDHQPNFNYQLKQQIVNLHGSQAVASFGGQSKSSLINMLLLDATMPTGNQLRLEHKISGSGYGQRDSVTSHNQLAIQQQTQQPSLKVRKNLKNLFQSNSFKFHKLNNQNKRGLYLTAIVYHSQGYSSSKVGNSKDNQTSNKSGKRQSIQSNKSNANKQHGQSSDQNQQQNARHFQLGPNDKIVVTNDDRLPVIEVLNDLVSPSALMGDFYWLLKINGTQWMDIKRIRQQLQKSHSSSTLHLRIKLLSAIEQMQLALNLEDIGRLFYRPIQAHDGSIVICTSRHVENTKLVSNLSIKWTPQHKIIPRHLRKISDSMINNAASAGVGSYSHGYGGGGAGGYMSNSSQRDHSQSQRESICTNAGSISGPSGSLANIKSATSNGGGVLTTTSTLTTLTTSTTTTTTGKRESRDAMLMMGATILPATTLNPAYLAGTQTLSNGSALNSSLGSNLNANCNQMDQPVLFSAQSAGSTTTSSTQFQSTAAGLIASTSSAFGLSSAGVASSSSSSSYQPQQQQIGDSMTAAAGEFKLCDHCQSIIQFQRRCTMASGSSSSSIASNESQRSSLAANLSAAMVSNNSALPNASATTNRNGGQCSCGIRGGNSNNNNSNNSNGANLSNSSTHLQLSGPNSNSLSSQRGSTGSQVRSGSMVSGANSAAHATGHTRQTQSQQLTAPQKSSTYLMLASLSIYDLLLFSLNEIVEFDRMSTQPLNRGLYLGFVQLQTTVESMRLLVPRSRPNMVPCARIRDNAHVSKEEWQLLKRFSEFNPSSAGGVGSRSPAGGGSQSTTEQLQLSDPSIWSDDVGVEGGDDGQVDDDSSQATTCLLNKQQSSSKQLTVGFDRSRAKSVSPGLLDRKPERSAEFVARSVASTCSYRDHKGSLTLSNERILSSGDSKSINSAEDDDNDDSSHHETSSCGSSRRQSKQPAMMTSAAASGGSINSMLSAGSQAPEVGSSEHQVATTSSNTNNNNTMITTMRRQAIKQGSKRAPTRSGSRLTVNSLANITQSPEETFVRLVGSAARRLLDELSSQLPRQFDEQTNSMISSMASLNDQGNNRIYHVELIELSQQVTFILLIPSAENVCPVTSHEKSNILTDNKDLMLLPLQIFETIHIGTYEPDLLGKYSRLSAILETDLIVAQHDHRQAFSSNELKSTKSRVSSLQDMVGIADEFWRQLRWIVDVVSFARDKSTSSSGGCIRLCTIWKYFNLSPLSETTSLNSPRLFAADYSSGMNFPSNSFLIDRSPLGAKESLTSVQTPTQKQLASSGRSGYEVKRTISEKQQTSSKRTTSGDNEQASPTTSCQVNCGHGTSSVIHTGVPEIHLTKYANHIASNKRLGESQGRTEPGAVNASTGSGGSRKVTTNRRFSDDENRRLREAENDYANQRRRQVILNKFELNDYGLQCNIFTTDSRSVCVEEIRDGNEYENENENDNGRAMEDEKQQVELSATFEHGLPEIPKLFMNEVVDDEEELEGREDSGDDGSKLMDNFVEDDDDKAIYAYHISLRDATRAANQRKSSQHSVRPVIDGLDDGYGSHLLSTTMAAQGEASSNIQTRVVTSDAPTEVRQEADHEVVRLQKEAGPPRKENNTEIGFNRAGEIDAEPNLTLTTTMEATKDDDDGQDGFSCDNKLQSSLEWYALQGDAHFRRQQNQQRKEDGKASKTPEITSTIDGCSQVGPADENRGSLSSATKLLPAEQQLIQTEQAKQSSSRPRRHLKSTNPFLTDSFDCI